MSLPDGLLESLREGCKDYNEWNTFLEENKNVKQLVEKWYVWLSSIPETVDEKFVIPKLPFSESEMDYLNSTFIHSLHSVEDTLPIRHTWRIACIKGCLNIVEWLFTKYQDILDNRGVNSNIFMLTAIKGHTCILKYLVENNLVTLENRTINTSLYYACKEGYLDTAKWIFETYRLGNLSTDWVRKIFLTTCEENHLNVSRWLYSVFHTRVWTDKRLFSNVCRLGLLEMAQWLYQTFEFNTRINLILGACRSGQFEVVQWLVNDVFENRLDKQMLTKIFITSCYHNQIDIAKWITSKYVYIFSFNVDNLFIKACALGHYKIVKWLYDMFECTRLVEAYNIAQKNKQYDIMNLLYNKL